MPTLSKSAVILVLLFSLNAKASDAVVPQEVQGLVTKYCIACHGNDAAEADVNLTSLAELDLSTRLELLNNAHEQLHFSKMPPQDADQRIELDLDDGVKVNYGKFGDLLAEVKAVHGKKV